MSYFSTIFAEFAEKSDLKEKVVGDSIKRSSLYILKHFQPLVKLNSENDHLWFLTSQVKLYTS